MIPHLLYINLAFLRRRIQVVSEANFEWVKLKIE